MNASSDAVGKSGARPSFRHMGMEVTDIEAMAEFYTTVVGMTITDRGFSPRSKNNFVFMTTDPAAHHQIVLVDGRGDGAAGNVNQLSFTVPSLEALRQTHARLAALGIDTSPVDHGNAWSIYFADPEGNGVEIYLDSPFHVPQPHGVALDLSLDDDAIRARTAERIGGEDGFMKRAEWLALLAKRMETDC